MTDLDVAAAAAVFGERLPLAQRYAQLLVTDGIRRGLVGPGEADRIWSRHLLNCAVVAEGCPVDAVVVDVGSGAGLPGIPLALARGDVRVVLLEPLARRTAWLSEVVPELRLADRVRVVRGRAEEVSDVEGDVVVSRAVAPLARLLPWCVPLTRRGGIVIAMKGASVTEELESVATRLDEWGLSNARVARFGERALTEPTTAVVAERSDRGGPRERTTISRATGRDGSRRRRRPGMGERPRRST